MKLLVFANDYVGKEISIFLCEEFKQDIGLFVTTSQNDLYRELIDSGLPVEVFSSSEKMAAKITADFDLGVLAWWPTIIKPALIDKPRRGFINTHPSLLPFNRGKHYNFWAIVEDVPFGVTLHMVDTGVDTGPIIAQKEISYDWTDTGESLYFKARTEMISLFKQVYPRLRENLLEPVPQDLSIGSFHKGEELEQASHIILDSDYKARDLLNRLRARTFQGYPACYFRDGDETFEVTVNIRRKNDEPD